MQQIGFVFSKEIMGKLDGALIGVVVHLVAWLVRPNLSERVKIELPHKTGKLGMLEIPRKHRLQRKGGIKDMSVDIGDINHSLASHMLDITYIGKSPNIANDKGKAVIIPPSDAGITGVDHVVGFCTNEGRETRE